MKANHLKLVAIMVAVITIAAISPVQKKKKKKVIHAIPSVVFFDDFSGKSIDRTKWNVMTSHEVTNNEQQTYIDSSSTVYIAHGAEADGAKNGALVLKSVYNPGYITKEGKKFDFLSGRVDSRTKVEFTYGSISARMKLPAGSGLWPAFWALGNDRWPDCGEIDIMENIGETDWLSAAVHGPGYFGETPIVNKVYLKKGKEANQWHIYTVDWDANSMTFKVDNEMYYRVTRPMIENYGKWAFDNPKFLIINLALGGAFPVKVNGVKTPYTGLPQTTVEAIKKGKGKVLIDWVKITKL